MKDKILKTDSEGNRTITIPASVVAMALSFFFGLGGGQFARDTYIGGPPASAPAVSDVKTENATSFERMENKLDKIGGEVQEINKTLAVFTNMVQRHDMLIDRLDDRLDGIDVGAGRRRRADRD